MYARIGEWRGSAEELERWVTRSRTQVKPAVARQPGLVAALWLRDLDGPTGLTLTVWESESAMRASDGFAAATQRTTAEVSGAAVRTTRYEVVEQVAERPGSP